MNRDQSYGGGIFIIALIVTIVYLIAFFGPWLPFNIPNPEIWREWAIALPIFLLVLAALGIMMWIGWTMLTTPPPLPLENETIEEPQDVTEQNENEKSKSKKDT